MTDDDRLTERDRLLADVDGALTRWEDTGPREHNWQVASQYVTDALLDAGWVPPERVREAERRGAVEALREFGFWLEKNVSSPAAHRGAYIRADRLDQDGGA